MAKDHCITLAFGDVKLGGRFVVRDRVNDKDIALFKMPPIQPTDVYNTRRYELPGTIPNPPAYNAMRMDDDGVVTYFSFSNEVVVTFLSDF